MLDKTTVSRHYTFKEISSITGVKPYVLRFWETEFDEIKPIISEIGEKLYSDSDIEAIDRIKKLLFEDKLSIPEAKLKFFDIEEMINDEFDKLDIPNETNFFRPSPTGKQALLLVQEKIAEIKKRNGWN